MYKYIYIGQHLVALVGLHMFPLPMIMTEALCCNTVIIAQKNISI